MHWRAAVSRIRFHPGNKLRTPSSQLHSKPRHLTSSSEISYTAPSRKYIMDHPSAKSVAHRVFRSLPGEWSLERIAVSRNNFQPGGRFSGSARFQPQANSSTASGLEYLYTEEGEFTFAGGKLTAKRHYVWRYDERSDTISVWFVRTDDHTRADYLYHEVEFAKASPGSSTVTAGASHLCVRDLYGVKYTFHISEDKVHSWRLLCEVKGPAKDYTLDSAYSRL